MAMPVLPARLTYQRPLAWVASNHCEPPGPGGDTGMSCPPSLACTLTVNRTVALARPAGRTDVIFSAVTVNRGPPIIIDRTHVRSAGSTVRATALALFRPSADQNARTACSAFATSAGDRVPETRGGLGDPVLPKKAEPCRPLAS